MTNYIVTNLNDTGAGSLRDALNAANAGPGADTITFTSGLSGTIALTSGTLVLTQDVTINGDTNGDFKADITISGNNATSIFQQSNATTDVVLSSLTLANGNGGAGIDAGAINATYGTLIIRDTSIINNVGNFGGAIRSFGTNVIVANSLISGNSASAGGGIFFNAPFGGFLELINSTLYGNSVTQYGGGIASLGVGNLNIYNSTITNNRADLNGTTSSSGGGINSTSAGVVNISNSAIAGNFVGTGTVKNDIVGNLGSVLNNAFGTTFSVSGSGNLFSVSDLGLGQLLDNGGTVLTRSPLDGSILIGVGYNGLPVDSGDIDHDGNTTEQLPLDGRGGLRIVGGTVDIGAVEQIVNETIRGTASGNFILGGLGDDVIEGKGGADTLNGGTNTSVGDTLSYVSSALGVSINLATNVAQAGDAQGDIISNFENVTGSAFGDQLVGDGSNNVLRGNAGNDLFVGGLGADTMIGGADLDVVDYTSFAIGVSVNLTAGTGPGGDVISEIENITGSAFGDVLNGDNGANTMRGGAGNDFMVAGNGADLLIGGADNDEVSYETATTGVLINLITGTGANGGVLQQIENIRGSAFGDVLQGDNGSNTIRGLAGNDYIIAGNGADLIIGGADNDTVSYETATSGIFANLTTGIGANGGVLQEIENLTGSAFGDVLIGSALGNTLKGGAGNDYIVGNAGSDALFGGLDSDTFRFETTTFGNDVITDFQDNADKLSFASAIASGFGQFVILNNNSTNVTVQIAGQSIVVQGVSNISLTATDFLFV